MESEANQIHENLKPILKHPGKLEFNHYASNLWWMILMGLPAAIALLMLISWWLAGRAMQPIYQSYQLL